jgi:hypothetical protein
MADDSLGKLIAYLGVDSAALVAGSNRAKDALKDIDDKMNITVGSAAKLTAGLIAAGATMAAVMVKRTTETIDAQGELAQQLGISIESLTSLKFAASTAGLSQEDLTSSTNKLNRTIAEAAAGSKDQAAAFSELGVSATNVDGTLRAADEVMLDIADRFSEMEDGAAKAAIAQEIFGRSGAKMIPLLNQGSAAIKEQQQLARQLGLVISGETAAAADQFSDNLTILSQVGGGFANRLTAELLPTLNNVSDVLIDTAKSEDVMTTASSALSTMLKGLVTVGLYVGATFTDVGKWIGALAAAAVAAASGDFSRANSIIQEASRDSAAIMEATEAKISKVWSNVAASAEESATKQLTSLVRLTEAQRKAAEEAEDAEKRRLKANADTVASLQEQAAVLGMTAAQATLYKLSMDGATTAQLEAAAAARVAIDAFAGLQSIGQIKMGAMDADDAALAALQEKYQALNDIIARNPELQAQAGEAAALLAQQYQNSVDAQIAAGQQNHDAFIAQQQAKVEAIRTQNETELALILEKHEAEREVIEQLQLSDLENKAMYDALWQDLETQHEAKLRNMKLKSWDDLKKLTKVSWQAQVSIMSGSLADMTAALSTKSRTMFEINKAAAMANATVRIPEMMVNAYNALSGIPYVGPYLGAAAAAAAGIFGAAQVAAIGSTSFGGGGGAGGAANVPSMATSSVGQSGAGAGPAAPSQSLAVEGLSGDQLFTGEAVRALAGKLLDFQKDGGQVVFK